VRSGASRVRNVDALFFMLGCAPRGFPKKRTQTRYTELVFFASGGIHGSNSAFCCDQATKMSMHYFSCSGEIGTDTTNSVL
jgi:hypothetical protein